MLRDHNELFNIAFCVFAGKAKEVNWEKAEKPIIHDWDLITWGPEAKLLSKVMVKSWNKHGKGLIKSVKNAFTLDQNISVDRKKIESAFKRHKNIGKKIWKDSNKKAVAILKATSYRALGHFKKQSRKRTKAEVDDAFDLFIANALSDHIEAYLKEYPERVLHPEIIRLVELAEASDELRDVDKALLLERIKKIDTLGPNYVTNVADVNVGRAWTYSGLELAYQNEVEEYMWVAHLDDPNRPCSPCTRLHGKRFNVLITRDKVLKVLAEKDPDKISEIAPFPRVEDLDAKSPEEIMNGAHSPPAHNRCFAEGTEVYTNKGWKFFEDLNGEELFLSRKKSGELEWVKAIRYIEYKHEGKMIRLLTNSFELITTKDHSQPFEKRVDRRKNGRKYELFMKPMEEVVKHQKYRIPRTAFWNAKENKCSKLEARFLGWFLSEGNASKVVGLNKWKYQVKIAQNYENLFTVIRDIIGIGEIHMENEAIYIPISEERYNELKSYGIVAGNKIIPNKIKESSIEIIQEFLKTYIKGDGSRKKYKWKEKNLESEAIIFHASSKKMAEDLGELILKCGGYPYFYIDRKKGDEMTCPRTGKKYCIKNDQWRILWNKSKYSLSCHIKVEEIDYNGYVRDVELEKNHVLWIRYKGKTCFSGNCRCDIIFLWKRSI